MNRSKVALMAVLLFCVLNTALYHPRLNVDDFKVYYTAASFIHEHHSLLIYNGADTGIDPQLRHADPDSLFAQQARRFGIPIIRMYVYPPVVADLLVPFTVLRLSPAVLLWTGLNVLIVAVVCFLLVRLLRLPLTLWSMGALVLGTVTFLPILESLVWGQVSVLLLGLWTLGVFCYARNWQTASALALALATAIKLTPLIAIVPFLLWLDWRWLRTYVAGLVAIGLGTWAINGSACLNDCFRHVIPAMSNGNPFSGNKSIPAGVQLLFEAFHGINVHQILLTTPIVPVPHMVVVLGKLVSLLCLVAAVALMWRFRTETDRYTRMVTLSLLPLLSTLVSPVSWKHAYAVALLTYIVLWAEAFRRRVPTGYLVLLAICSVELNWFVISYAFRFVIHGAPLGLVFLASSFCGIALVLYRLAFPHHFAGLEPLTTPRSTPLPEYA